MAGFTLRKSIMERYDIHINSDENWRCAWATISISADGFFNAQTDCGDFSYRWGHLAIALSHF